MTKLELIERIIDRITDPWTESCEDYRDAELIDLVTAGKIIDQCREEDNYNDPEDRLPAEVTPELMMIAYNCNVRKNRHELKVNELAKVITEYNLVCEYANYYAQDHEDCIEIIPVDFILNDTIFPFTTEDTENPDLVDTLRIGLNSHDTFSFDHEYCWFDRENEILHSTDNPFRDGTVNAKDFAAYLLSPEGQDGLDYILNDVLSEEDLAEITDCTKDYFMEEV